MSNSLSLSNRRSLRHTFGVLTETVNMPNLIAIQISSYQQFLDSQSDKNKKSELGIDEALKSIFPVKDYAGRMSLKYISYKLDRPKYDVIECRQRGLTYSAALKVVFRLDIINIDEDTGDKIGQDAREEEVYLGDIPLMTNEGTFLVNGIERVIINQIVRSPGIYYKNELDKQGYKIYTANLVANRGTWIKFEIDKDDLIYVKIDKAKKFSAYIFLRALNLENYEIFDGIDAEELFITSNVTKTIQDDVKDQILVSVKKADGTKCARCWKIVKNINENKCSRTKICPLQNVRK